MEPTEAIQAAETALRDLVRRVLGAAWETADKAPDPVDLRRKQEEDSKRRDGAVVSDDLLAYTDLRHLTALIEANWEPFKPVFGDLQRTRAFFGVLEDLRNPVAHSRDLLPFERDLLAGITGQLRNQITLFRTREDGPQAYYPVIESVTDSFGNVLPERYSSLETHPVPRLNVGDQVKFRCVGWDPRGRELVWELHNGEFRYRGNLLESCISNEPAELTWTVSESDVGEYGWISVAMKHSDEKFHRYRNEYRQVYDASVEYGYAVNPPLD